MKKIAFAILMASAAIAHAQSAFTPSAPQTSTAFKPATATASKTGSATKTGAGIPKAEVLTQSSGSVKDPTITPIVINNKVSIENVPSQNHADQLWMSRSLVYTDELQAGNTARSPAALDSNVQRTLYPWIQMLRRIGHEEAKIELELSRLTHSEFKAWAERVTAE